MCGTRLPKKEKVVEYTNLKMIHGDPAGLPRVGFCLLSSSWCTSVYGGVVFTCWGRVRVMPRDFLAGNAKIANLVFRMGE